MLQNIIVLIIILSALTYVLLSLYHNLTIKKSNKCNGCCSYGSKNTGSSKHAKVYKLKCS